MRTTAHHEPRSWHVPVNKLWQWIVITPWFWRWCTRLDENHTDLQNSRKKINYVSHCTISADMKLNATKLETTGSQVTVQAILHVPARREVLWRSKSTYFHCSFDDVDCDKIHITQVKSCTSCTARRTWGTSHNRASWQKLSSVTIHCPQWPTCRHTTATVSRTSLLWLTFANCWTPSPTVLHPLKVQQIQTSYPQSCFVCLNTTRCLTQSASW